MKKQLLLASTNPGKINEMRAILQSLPLELLTPADIQLSLEVAETGDTYRENATLKAQAFAQASGMISLADDSGLEVAALNGAPGIHSARYAPQPNATDADRRARLISELQNQPRPWEARFYCLVAIATPEAFLHYSEGICPGEIIPEPRGQDGFGYDPIFLLPTLQKTMAELDTRTKNEFSHRGQAVKAALPILRNLFSIGLGK